MTSTKNTSSVPRNSSPPSVRHVNWHEAAACAIEIEPRDYASLLQFLTEYILGKNSYRIDLLVIRKLSGQEIPKKIARIFRTYNLFEVKGIHSSVSTATYYKTIGYAGLFIDQISAQTPITGLDVSITFLAFHYPRKLIRHLKDERKITVAKKWKGIYYISKETFKIQIIVTRELPPDENLYLRCLTDHLQDSALINRLADDYTEHQHQNQSLYNRYMHQLTTANLKPKGGSHMVCEGLLNLFGTSSAEIIENTRRESEEYYLPKINELADANKQLAVSNKLLSSQIDYLQSLLKQNNISFE